VRRRPRVFAFLSAPVDTSPSLGSLADNQLCGNGIYTTEGITKLCEALKGSAVTSLKCAAAPVSAFLSTPIDTIPPSLLTVWPTTCSAASTSMEKGGPTPQTASPSCARVSREAP
jgi:hypothetical protein